MKNMRKLSIFLSALFLFGCAKADLSQEEATRLIEKDNAYPRVATEIIFCGDVVQAKRILDLGLENEGLVNIIKTKQASQIAAPWVSFTEKAKPYLMATPDEDLKYQRQHVRIGDMKFKGIIGVTTTEDGRTAKVVYNIVYSNLSPFAKIFKVDYKKPVKMTAYFANDGAKWRLLKKIDDARSKF